MAAAPRTDRRLGILLVATALCYLIGYPLALIGHSPVGWVFVALGGPFLIALVAVVIHRVHVSSAENSAGPAPAAVEQPPASS